MSKKRTKTVDNGEAIRLAGELFSLPIAGMLIGCQTDTLEEMVHLEAKAKIDVEKMGGWFPSRMMLSFMSALVLLKRANVDAEISVIIRERTA